MKLRLIGYKITFVSEDFDWPEIVDVLNVTNTNAPTFLLCILFFNNNNNDNNNNNVVITSKKF